MESSLCSSEVTRKKLTEVEGSGHVSQCPIAGDGNAFDVGDIDNCSQSKE